MIISKHNFTGKGMKDFVWIRIPDYVLADELDLFENPSGLDLK